LQKVLTLGDALVSEPVGFLKQIDPVPVDPNSPVPAYVQLEQDLRRQIQSGKQPYGSRLPPEQALARLYGVSRVTLRQALHRLADAGLISRRHGIGTIITPLPQVSLDLRPMESVTQQLRHAGYNTAVKLLEQTVREPPREAAQALNLTAGQKTVVISRLLRAQGSPVSLITSWLPSQLFPGLESVPLSPADDSLWNVLAHTYRRAPARGKNVLEVTTCSAQEAKLLQVGFGMPLIRLSCTVCDAQEYPIEYTTALWVTTGVRLHF
jgi:GntR family transcriptional regulator